MVQRVRGTQASTPAEAAAGADFVMCCVGNDDDVRAVLLGSSGALAGMESGALLIDHTTASAKLAQELAAHAQAAGVGFMDAPVSGGEAGAVTDSSPSCWEVHKAISIKCFLSLILMQKPVS